MVYILRKGIAFPKDCKIQATLTQMQTGSFPHWIAPDRFLFIWNHFRNRSGPDSKRQEHFLCQSGTTSPRSADSKLHLCQRDATFSYSEYFELAWLATQSILPVIVIVALKKVPALLGYRTTFHQLKFHPSFWSLVIHLLIALSRYVMLLTMSPKFFISSLLLNGFAVNVVLIFVIVCVLDYTHLNFLRWKYLSYVFVFPG